MPTKGNGRRQESALTVGMMLSKDVYLTVGALNLGDYIMFAAPKGLVNFWGTSGKEWVSPNGWEKSTYWEIYHFLSTVVQMIRVSSSAHNLSSSLFNISCVPSSNGLRGFSGMYVILRSCNATDGWVERQLLPIVPGAQVDNTTAKIPTFIRSHWRISSLWSLTTATMYHWS